MPSNKIVTDFIEKIVHLAVLESRKAEPGVVFEITVPAKEIPEGIHFSDIRGAVEAKASRSNLVTMGSSDWIYRFYKR